MFKFPAPPDVFAVRHLECISCKYILSVSEEEIRKPRRQSSSGRRSYPEMSPGPGPDPVIPLPPSDTNPLYCPRCGADNRNWLYLSYYPIKEFGPKYKKFMIFAGVIALIVLLAGLISYQQYNNYFPTNPIRFVVQIIILVLALILPFAIITTQWRDLRDYRYLRRVAKPPFISMFSPPVKTSLILGFIFVLLIPVTYYLVLPAVQKTGKNIVMAAPEKNQVERVDQLTVNVPAALAAKPAEKEAILNITSDLNQVLYEEQSVCTEIELSQISATLKAILTGKAKTGNAALLANAVEQLDKMQESEVGNCQPELLAGIALLLQAYLNSDEATNIAAGDGLCINPNVQLEALQGKTLPILDPDCYEELITQFIVKLETRQEDFIPPDLSSATDLEIRLWVTSVLGGIREIAVKQPDSALPARIETDLASLEKRVAPPKEDDGMDETVTFVFTWIRFVGVTAVLSSLVAIWFANKTEKEYDPHLPRPIFNSVSKMAPVAKWEINRTLQPHDLATQIQWMNVERNKSGGINLTGLFREVPELVDGDLTNKVRAQKYVVETDPWCYIRKTSITDVVVPRPAGGPAFVLPAPSEEPEQASEIEPPASSPPITISRNRI